MTRVIDLPWNPEVIAWKWMRYSGLLLIPLAWGHVLIQDVLVGVDRIDLNYVSMRWAFIGWRVYDFFSPGICIGAWHQWPAADCFGFCFKGEESSFRQ